MSKIDDKYFNFIPYQNGYNYRDKEKNVQMYVKYMLNRSLAMFKYHNLPDTIPQMELEKMNQCAGGSVWYKHNDELYVFNATLGGEGDVYNRPTKAIISNTFLKLNKECAIDEDCVFMQNDSMCLGLIPLYEKYCTILNETDITMILATINRRIQMLISANDDNTVESAKLFIKNIEDGKLGVIAESKLFDSLKTNTVATSNTNSLQDICNLQQYVKASMYNEIGLGANWNSKKEHLITAEVETNSDNLYPLVDDMLTSRRKALEKINEMFGTNITVEFNSSWDYRLYNGENIDTLEDDNINTESSIKTSDETTEETSDETTEETSDETTEETSDETTEETSDETTEETSDETTEETSDETTEETSDETTEETSDETTEETSDETTEETSDETTEETSDETTEETSDETTEETSDETTEETSDETTEETSDETKGDDEDEE